MLKGVKTRLARHLDEDRRVRWRQAAYTRAGLYEALTFIDGNPEEKVLRKSTSLVIDGFPRSGQSYLVGAVEEANPHLRLCTHAHSPYVINRAVRLRIPHACLVRRPKDVAASYVQFLPGLSLQTATSCYVQYYERLLHNLGRVHFLPFDLVTTDLEGALTRIGSAWGLDLRAPRDEAAVRERVHQSALRHYGENRLWEVVALPTSARASANDVWADATPIEIRLLDRATELYAAIMSRVEGKAGPQ